MSLQNSVKQIIKRMVRLSDYAKWFLFSPYKLKTKKEKINRVLVVNLAFLGDVLAITPLIKNLSRKYSVDVLVKEESKEILKNNPSVNEILVFKNDEDFLKKYKLKYDAAVCVWPCDYEMGATLLKAGIPYRLGATQQSRPEKGRFFMTCLTPPFLLDKHKAIENIVIAKPLLTERIDYPLEVFPAKNDKNLAVSFLKKQKIKKFAVIHAAARSKKTKEWSDERFASIADYLIEKKNFKVVFGGAEKDKSKNEDIIAKMRNRKNALNLAGKTTLLEYSAIISKANLVISVSTVTLHLACAFKRKLLGIYSENIKIWYPWQNLENSEVILKEDLSKLSEKEVIGKIEKLI